MHCGLGCIKSQSGDAYYLPRMIWKSFDKSPTTVHTIINIRCLYFIKYESDVLLQNVDTVHVLDSLW
jgi:hypothetical protein